MAVKRGLLLHDSDSNMLKVFEKDILSTITETREIMDNVSQ